MFRYLLRQHILTAYKNKISNDKGQITTSSIKNYIVGTSGATEALGKVYNGWDLTQADTYKPWENFLNKEDKWKKTSDIILEAMCIAFEVPGCENLNIQPGTVTEINPLTASNYYVGFFFSDRYELKRCLVEISADDDVKLFYIEPEANGEIAIKKLEHEYYQGKIMDQRAVILTKGNRYSLIILSDSYHKLSDNCEESSKLCCLSGLWIKERLEKYETVSSLLFKKIKKNDIETIKKAEINEEEIIGISGWRYDKLPFKVHYATVCENNDSPFTNLPGTYEVYECLTDKKAFSCFILNISGSFEISLYQTKNSKNAKFGYLKPHPHKETIILTFPPVEGDTAKSDHTFIILQLPPDHFNNKNVLTGCICETNKGKPYYSGVYARRVPESAPQPLPKRIELNEMIATIRNNPDEYADFLNFFLGKNPDHPCIITHETYKELCKIQLAEEDPENPEMEPVNL